MSLLISAGMSGAAGAGAAAGAAGGFGGGFFGADGGPFGVAADAGAVAGGAAARPVIGTDSTGSDSGPTGKAPFDQGWEDEVAMSCDDARFFLCTLLVKFNTARRRLLQQKSISWRC